MNDTGRGLDAVPWAVRAWCTYTPLTHEGCTCPQCWKPDTAPQGRRWRPSRMVVFDTETTTDLRQSLLMGAYRYVELSWGTTTPVARTLEEGVFVPDDDAEALTMARSHVRRATPAGGRRLVVHTRSSFVEKVVYRACWINGATLVGFNLPFDVSRLAIGWHPGSGHNRGAFSLQLRGDYRDFRYRPRVVVRRLGAAQSLRWGGTKELPEGGVVKGPFLDCYTLAKVLANRPMTLERACGWAGVGYTKPGHEFGTLTPELIDYCRADVGATSALAGALVGMAAGFPARKPAHKWYSTATLGAECIAGMGVRPPLHGEGAGRDIPSSVLAAFMAAFYGGRSELAIRKELVPVVTLDFSGQYVAVARLLGLWQLVTAERLTAESSTEAARVFLDRVTATDITDPATWREMGVTVCEVEPAGDLLPVRVRLDEPEQSAEFSTVVLPVTGGRSWWTLADLVAAKVEGGSLPRILSAWRIVGTGEASGLSPVELPGGHTFDPRQGDWWAFLSDIRRRANELGDDRAGSFAKLLGNSTAYGNWVRFDTRAGSASGTRAVLTLPDGQDVALPQCAETPGPWTFPPFASVVTAGGRLLQSAVRAMVNDAGGTVAYGDTDSTYVVATPEGGPVSVTGGPIEALSWQQVDELVSRFTDPVSLRIEPENYEGAAVTGARRQRQLRLYGIAPKRYCLTDSAGAVVKGTEHELGEYLPPIPTTPDEFARQAWAYYVTPCECYTDDTDDKGDEGDEVESCTCPQPAWLDHPAIKSVSATWPESPLLELAEGWPFNFCAQGHEGADLWGNPGKALYAPLDREHQAQARTFMALAGDIGPRSWRHLLARWGRVQSTAYLPANGRLNGYGLCLPRHLTLAGPAQFHGKEAFYGTFGTASQGKLSLRTAGEPWSAAVKVLAAMGPDEASKRTARPARKASWPEPARPELRPVHPQAVYRVLNGATPQATTRRRLAAAAVGFTRWQLRTWGLKPQAAPLQAWLLVAPEHGWQTCGAAGCGEVVVHGRKWCLEHRPARRSAVPTGTNDEAPQRGSSRHCRGCGEPLDGAPQQRWCSKACQMRVRRAKEKP